MSKLVFLLLVCGFGTIWCESHEQQMEYADKLITEIEGVGEEIDEIIKNINTNTEEGRDAIMLHANTFNFDMHHVLNSLQYLASRNEQKSPLLQETVTKLNDIAYDSEESFKKGITFVKMQLRKTVRDMVDKAKTLRQIVRENSDYLYVATVLRSLDEVVTATQKITVRNGFQHLPKILIKLVVKTVRTSLTLFLSFINSEDKNVHNDITRYSSYLSSWLSEYADLLKDLTFTYKTNKFNDVKEIVYELGKISHENEEVLHSENSFEQIKDQLRFSIVNSTVQIEKLVDVGISAHGRDDNMIYVVLPQMIAQAMMLQRNFERTYDNYINV